MKCGWIQTKQCLISFLFKFKPNKIRVNSKRSSWFTSSWIENCIWKLRNEQSLALACLFWKHTLLCRFKIPKEISVEEPSGDKSHSRAQINPHFLSLESFKCRVDVPSNSNGSCKASPSKHTDFESSGRWSCGNSAVPDHGIYSPLHKPVEFGDLIRAVVPNPVGSWRRELFPSHKTWALTLLVGQMSSPIQRPGRLDGFGSGGWLSWIKATNFGASITSFCTPLSQ